MDMETTLPSKTTVGVLDSFFTQLVAVVKVVPGYSTLTLANTLTLASLHRLIFYSTRLTNVGRGTILSFKTRVGALDSFFAQLFVVVCGPWLYVQCIF